MGKKTKRGLGGLRKPTAASPVERAAGIQAGRVKRGERKERKRYGLYILPAAQLQLEALKLKLDLEAFENEDRRVTLPDLQEAAYRLILREHGLRPVF